jgi:hypothetical protein
MLFQGLDDSLLGRLVDAVMVSGAIKKETFEWLRTCGVIGIESRQGRVVGFNE